MSLCRKYTLHTINNTGICGCWLYSGLLLNGCKWLFYNWVVSLTLCQSNESMIEMQVLWSLLKLPAPFEEEVSKCSNVAINGMYVLFGFGCPSSGSVKQVLFINFVSSNAFFKTRLHHHRTLKFSKWRHKYKSTETAFLLPAWILVLYLQSQFLDYQFARLLHNFHKGLLYLKQEWTT